MALFCFGSLIDVFMFPLSPEFADVATTGTLAYSFIFLLFFIVTGSAWLRLNTQRRILRESYREVRSGATQSSLSPS